MIRFRHRDQRKIEKLARALATLDDHARIVRPARKRAARISFS